MPLYVPAGAIIPVQPVIQYVDERSIEQLRLRIFPGTGKYTISEDDGHTFEEQHNILIPLKYVYLLINKPTVVEIEVREGEWTLAPREVIVLLVGVGEQRFQDDGKPRSLKFQQ